MGKWGFIWKDPPFSMGKSTISMVIFNSYFDITRGYDLWENMGNQWEINGKSMGNQWEYPGLVTIITNNSQIIVLGKVIIYLSDLIFRQNGV